MSSRVPAHVSHAVVVPLTYTRFNFLRGIARFLRQIRIGFILVSIQVFFNFLLALVAGLPLRMIEVLTK